MVSVDKSLNKDLKFPTVNDIGLEDDGPALKPKETL